MSVREQMRRNSQAWGSASASERKRLEAQNKRLGSQIGGTFNSGTGKWSDSSGGDLYRNNPPRGTSSIDRGGSTRNNSNISQMQKNSQAWGNAGENERRRLEAQNRKLGKQVGGTFDSGTGRWSNRSGGDLYGSNRTSTPALEAISNRARGVDYGSYTDTSRMTSSLQSNPIRLGDDDYSYSHIDDNMTPFSTGSEFHRKLGSEMDRIAALPTADWNNSEVGSYWETSAMERYGLTREEIDKMKAERGIDTSISPFRARLAGSNINSPDSSGGTLNMFNPQSAVDYIDERYPEQDWSEDLRNTDADGLIKQRQDIAMRHGLGDYDRENYIMPWSYSGIEARAYGVNQKDEETIKSDSEELLSLLDAKEEAKLGGYEIDGKGRVIGQDDLAREFNDPEILSQINEQISNQVGSDFTIRGVKGTVDFGGGLGVLDTDKGRFLSYDGQMKQLDDDEYESMMMEMYSVDGDPTSYKDYDREDAIALAEAEIEAQKAVNEQKVKDEAQRIKDEDRGAVKITPRKPSVPAGSNTKSNSFIDSARSMLGYSYSQANRMGSSSADCSSLVGRAMKDAGLTDNAFMTTRSIPNDSRFTKIPRSEAKPGDILWMKGHVGIKTDRGILEASSSQRGVVERNRAGNDFTHAYRINGQ